MVADTCRHSSRQLILICLLFLNTIISYGWLIRAYHLKNGWRAPQGLFNYWNTRKPVCFVLSYVLSVTQQYKQGTAWKASLQFIQSIRKIRIVHLWNTPPIFWCVKSIIPQFQQSQTRFKTYNGRNSMRCISATFICLALKQLCVCHKSLPYVAVKKEWGHKGSIAMQAL